MIKFALYPTVDFLDLMHLTYFDLFKWFVFCRTS